MKKINNETNKLAMYSYRAYPYGCSLLGRLAEKRNPTNVIIDAIISDKLFVASAKIVTLLERKPIMSFMTPKRILVKIPKKDATVP